MLSTSCTPIGALTELPHVLVKLPSSSLEQTHTQTRTQVCDLYKYQIYREVRVHASLQHENIVHLFAAFQEGDRVIMVQVRPMPSWTRHLCMQLALRLLLSACRLAGWAAWVCKDIVACTMQFSLHWCVAQAGCRP